MILARVELFRGGERKFCLVVVGMVGLLIIVFWSLNLFVFYFTFESVLVPTFSFNCRVGVPARAVAGGKGSSLPNLTTVKNVNIRHNQPLSPARTLSKPTPS